MVALVAGIALNAGATDTVNGELGAKIDVFLSRITPFGFSGTVLVAKGDQIVLNKGYGLAIRSQGVPNTADTIFCVGSITKQFTATAILTLEMQGKLKTDDPLTKYLENVPPDKADITLHHLLTHTSGLVKDVGGDYEQAGRDETVRKILALPLESKPGERFAYSNVNYTLLAAVVEKVSGQSYEDYLYEHLFKPAGMEWTGYRRPKWDESKVAHWYSMGRDNVNSLARPFPFWNLIGNGGILSTSGDMFKWHQALLGETILSPAEKKKMFTPYLNEYGYGWDVLKTSRGTVIQHNGGSDLGNNAEIRRYMDAGIVTILLCNQFYNGRPLIDAVRNQVEKVAFGEDVLLPPVVQTASSTTLKRFEGTYTLPTGGSLIATVDGNVLRVRASGQDAVLALVFPEGADLNSLDQLNQTSVRVMEAAIKGDFGPLSELLAEKERRLDAVREFVKTRISGEKTRTGELQKVEALQTLPSAIQEHAFETQVIVRGERGNLVFRLIWRDGKNVGIGPLDIATPVSYPFLPVSDTEFAGYDLVTARQVNIGFTAKTGAPDVLTIFGKQNVHAVKKVSADIELRHDPMMRFHLLRVREEVL
jgi:CubicO group peptidase (beta-lactamase class C family)